MAVTFTRTDLAHLLQQIFFVPRRQQIFQLETNVEMVFNGGLPTASYDNNVRNTGVNCLFHSVLDKRFIHKWQHFLGHCFGSR